MAKRKSPLLAKLGTAGAKAIANHSSDETSFDTGGSLPAGIENGIAQLYDCRFDVYKTGDNTGEYFFLAAGIVKAPAKHEGSPIEGLRTQIMEPLHATPTRSRKTVDAHFEWVLNQLRILGADTEDVTLKNIEEVVAALKEDAPHFRFRTWKGKKTDAYPDPRTNEVWGGIVDYEPEEGEEEVEDNTTEDDPGFDEGEEEETEEVETDEEEEEVEEETDEEEESGNKNDGSDWGAVGVAADEGDDAAQENLTLKAEEEGLDPDDFEEWGNLATYLAKNGAEEKEEEEEEEEEEDFIPEKDQVFMFTPPKKRKATEFLVTAVFAGKQTVNGKTLEDDKVFKGIPWSKLEEE